MSSFSESEISVECKSDKEYNPDLEKDESTDFSEEFVVSSNVASSEEYVSDGSYQHPRKKNKRKLTSISVVTKRPAIKIRSKETSTESSSEVWEGNDSENDKDSSEMYPCDKILLNDTRPKIERVIKYRVADSKLVGHDTSLYINLVHNAFKCEDGANNKNENCNNVLTIPSANYGNNMYGSDKDIIEKIQNSKGLNNDVKMENQYLIKWDGKSYLHCTWESVDSLNEMSAIGLKKIENFLKKMEQNKNLDITAVSDIIDEYSYEEFLNMERIIGMRNVGNRVEYLCKWKGLAYDHCTWEKLEIVRILYEKYITDYNNVTYYEPNRYELRNVIFPRDYLKILETSSGYNGLRDYQIEGVKWLINSCVVGNSVILADEMGLGKTVQIIKYLHNLQLLFNVDGPFLIIVPLSTLDSWLKHFHIWSSELYCVSFFGNKESRSTIKEYELNEVDNKVKYNVIITTYEWAYQETEYFQQFKFFTLIIDEAHRVKNYSSSLYQCLYRIKSFHRILMTGTPLQNTLRELWSLLHFIMPTKFLEPKSIEKYNDYEDKEEGFNELKKTISEFIIRRSKKDVEKSLPPKIEQILCVDMTKKQKQLYKCILTKNFLELSKESNGNSAGFVNIIMELKKCCNHAHLISYEESTNVEELLLGSGKLILLDKLLRRLKESNNRVLIFSQMVVMLDILAIYLQRCNFTYQRLDGTMSEAVRIKAIEHFNSPDSNDFCFLLSTKAGGLGISLVSADTVIIYDSDWNPQNDLQAQARAHRIGQTKQVKIYRLLTKNSIEEDILERAKHKMVLDQLVIQTMDKKFGKPGQIKFNKEELSMILKFGAQELFKEDINDTTKEPLQELDLDAIMQIAERNEVKQSHCEEFLSSFKVANFKSADIIDEEIVDATPKLKWHDIIPKSDIAKIMNEKRQNELLELYLPPRRSTNKNIHKSSSPELDTNSEDEVELNKREIRSFFKEYTRFPNVANRLDELINIKKFNIDKTDSYKKLSRLIVKSMNDQKPFKVSNIEFNFKELNEYKKYTDVISNAIESMPDFKNLSPQQVKSKYNLPNSIYIASRASFNSKWSKTDDSRLVVGVYYHGIHNWCSMALDEDLELKESLKGSKSTVASPNLIFDRLKKIIKDLSALPKNIITTPSSPVDKCKKAKSMVSKPVSPKKKSTTIDKKTTKLCVDILKSQKYSLKTIQDVTTKQLQNHVTHLIKIGNTINEYDKNRLNITSDILWDFVSRFTQVSPTELKNFYNKISNR